MQFRSDIPAEFDLCQSGFIEMSDRHSERFVEGAIVFNPTKQEGRMIYHSEQGQLCRHII